MTDLATNVQLITAQYAGKGDSMIYSLSTPSVIAAALLVLLILAILIFTDLL